jgi:outer membrane protein insertion porin family
MRLSVLLMLLILLPQISSAAELTSEKRKLLSKRPHIEKIIISGNRSFSEGTIRKKLYSREDGIWQSLGLMRGNRFTKSNLAYDQMLLEYFYKDQGFPDAKVDIDISGSPESGQAKVLVNINEGIRYRISSVAVLGLMGQEEEKVLSIVSGLRPGDYFKHSTNERIKQDVKSYFANSGYPYAQELDTLFKNERDSTMAVKITIIKRDLVAFGNLVVDSTIITQRKVFEREVVFKRGDVYKRDKLFESQQRLIRTNLFGYVSLQSPDSMSQRDSLMPDFRVNALERPPKYVNFGAGATQDKEKDFLWSVSGTLGNRNINGTGRKMLLESNTLFQAFSRWGFVKQHFEFDYTEPYLFRIRMPLIFAFTYEPGVRSLLQDYRIQTISMNATLVREFSLWTKLSLSGTYEQFRIFGVNSTKAQQYKEELGLNVDREISLALETDTRPLLNKFNPPSGALTQYEFTYVGGLLGGDNSFIRGVYSWTKYNKFTRTGVFASRVKFGWVTEFGKSTEVPTKERFYLGGAYSVRGFGENELGPKDSTGNPAGGEAIGLLNLELRKPLFWQIWGSTFIDCGYNVADIKDVSFRDVAVTFGAGVQWISPVGPIRVDYGRRTNINDYPSGGSFHFSILYAF